MTDVMGPPSVDDTDVPHTLAGELRELGLLGQVWTITVVAFCIA